MSNSPPTTLGKYQIIREIARSNDIVYEAYDPLMNRRVALKELAMPGGSTSQQQEDRINRFKREAQAAGTLNHANIMTVHELGQEGDRFFMAMEYLDGHTLRNEIDTRGFLPIDRALEIANQILEGLEHAHKQGVVHRDIKPDNIQILSNGSIKITDFGIARLTFQPNLTMDGQVFGTPSYMSPEQVVEKEIDARSDLFSVGIVLYEMIGGQKPFPGDSVVSITYAIMNKEPDRLNQASYPLWQVISRALDKSPALRPSSAADMIQQLKDATRVDSSGQVQVAPQQTTIYGQIAPPPLANPYLNPYQQAPMQQIPAPPPVAYPYNPYSQPGQQGMQQVPTGFPQGYNAPVYYPPPPRQPLFKPETKQFVGKLIVSLIVIGTLFAVILMGINAAGQALENTSAQRHDYEVVKQLNAIDSKLPVEEQIRQKEALILKLKGEIQIKQAKSSLAVSYELLGKQTLQKGDLLNAEGAFQKAIENDPQNPVLYTNLGDLYSRKANVERDAVARIGFWQQSAESWRQAADQELSADKAGIYKQATAVTYYNLALDMYNNSGSYPASEVRTALELAERYAPPNSQIDLQIRDLYMRVQSL